MTTEDNGNVGYMKPTSSSNEDLSEYTDADESISAPTEFLAEFLSAVMLKDYVTALKYCKLNAASVVKDGNDSESEEDDGSEENSSSSETESSTDESSEGQEEEEVGVDNAGDKQSKGSSEGDGTTGSYSSLEDDEAETIDQLAALAARYQIDNVNLGNGNKIYETSLGSQFKNTNIGKATLNTGGNQLPFGTSSDSESPTEPVSQQTVAMLRARVVPNKI
ncbi:protein rtoA isoform X3 [Aethina tumida]|uniref:protein rtoA isoform X3 n=1 Tax=Aethina tumida TaxID=116153 RepID=UPI00096AF1C0|nr:protein rtoA isoform X3 [Aethina tumida]